MVEVTPHKPPLSGLEPRLAHQLERSIRRAGRLRGGTDAERLLYLRMDKFK